MFLHIAPDVLAPKSGVQRYSVAFLLYVAALLVTWLLLPITGRHLFLFFVAAGVVSTWYGGLGPGIFNLLLTTLSISLLFNTPLFSPHLDLSDAIELGLFTLIALFVNMLTEFRARAERQARLEREQLQIALASIGDAMMLADANEERYRAFISQSSEGIWRFELEQPLPIGLPEAEQIEHFYEYAYLAECNDAVAQMYGFAAPDEIVNARLGDFLVRSDPQNLAYLQAFIRSNYRLIDAESHEIDRHGNNRYFLNNLVGTIEDGQIVRAWGTQRDITERKHTAVALEQAYAAEQAARQQAESALHLREQFLSVASHELKTPLTSLMGNIQLIQRRARREGHLDGRDTRALAVAVQQASRLNQLIMSLLDISRIEAGQLTIEPAPLDLCVLAQRVVDEIQPALDGHTISLSCPDMPLMIEGDELRLEQVLQNLIQNALKYSPAPEPVTVAVLQVAQEAHITVTDRGIGIPPEAISQLFQRFYRAKNVDEHYISGMGIGLYVVKEIVRLHNGSVGVESEEGKGSTFTVRLPLAKL